MANKALDQELHSMISEFANQLTLSVRRSVLEQVVEAMGGSSSNGRVKRGPGRPRGSRRGPGRPRGSGKRSPEQVEALGAKLLAYLKSKPGQRSDQIATALRSDVKTIRLPMQGLLAAKKVKTKGQRRGMQYFAA
jgi:hypothetical protein